MGIPVEAAEWVLSANCLGRTDLFFAPDDSESRVERRNRESQAKAVCHSCVVRTQCLAEALSSQERFGIWGGMTERERRIARRSSADVHDVVRSVTSGRSELRSAAASRGD